MLKGKDYLVLARVFSFISAFIDRRIEQNRSASMTTMHTRYSEIVSEAARDFEQRICEEAELKRLKETVKRSTQCS